MAARKKKDTPDGPNFGPDKRVKYIGEGRVAIQTPKKTQLQHLTYGEEALVNGYNARHICEARPEQWVILGDA